MREASAPLCDDQVPVISTMGRGIQGDAYRVEIERDSTDETILRGDRCDMATGEWSSEWFSENVNGGELHYQYNLRPGTIPRTFTITFRYDRPGRPEWCWTTPAIPYIWTVDENGTQTHPDAIVGSGVATLFIKKTTETAWTEKLIYPDGWTREDFNAPEAEEPWTVNLTFGIGGDVDVPNIDDLAKILGITTDQIRQIILGNKVTINGISVSNLIDYIDQQDDKHSDALSDHVHADLGFNARGHASTKAFGGYDTVKAYIDAMIESKVSAATTSITNAYKTYVNNVSKSIGDIIYGATVNSDGTITIPSGTMVPVGNINVISGSDSFSDGYIRTSASVENNDIRAV